MTTKQTVLLKEIIFNSLPDFMDPTYQAFVLNMIKKYPKCLDVENLIEMSLAEIGGYLFVDAAEFDFNDEDISDSKTGTVNSNTRKIEIIGVETKIGSLRITIYNPLSATQPVAFLYIPKHYVGQVSMPCYGKAKHKKRLVITWTEDYKYDENYNLVRRGHFNKFEKFRVKTFRDLATMSDRRFYEERPSMTPLSLSTYHNLFDDPKTDPIPGISNPCTQLHDLFETVILPELQPIVPSVIS